MSGPDRLTGLVASLRRLGKHLQFASVDGVEVCFESRRLGDKFPSRACVKVGDKVELCGEVKARGDGQGPQLCVTEWFVTDRPVDVATERINAIRAERAKRKAAKAAKKSAPKKSKSASLPGGEAAPCPSRDASRPHDDSAGPQPLLPRSVRHAEKSRVSTCRFADTIASLAIEAFAQRRPRDGPEYHQTVLAAVVARVAPITGADIPAEFTVVSLGVGTKFLASYPKDPSVVSDMHAEVLARRGLQRYLYAELLRCFDDERSAGSATRSIFERARGEHDGGRGALQLRRGVTFHFYSSSAPCGNACIRRWAQGGQGPVFPDLAPDQLPVPGAHGRFHVQAREEGQVAVLAKGSIPLGGRGVTMAGAALGWDVGITHPKGTSPLSPSGSRILTCSDKIAIWNAVGWQGGVLAAIIGPVYVSSITIGRKFSKLHCERALCCRLQAFDPSVMRNPSPPWPYSIHHPVMMTTSVKFDDTALVETRGADFTEHRCCIWGRGSALADSDGSSPATGPAAGRSDGELARPELVEVLDGRTGRPFRTPSGSVDGACVPSSDGDGDGKGAPECDASGARSAYCRAELRALIAHAPISSLRLTCQAVARAGGAGTRPCSRVQQLGAHPGAGLGLGTRTATIEDVTVCQHDHVPGKVASHRSVACGVAGRRAHEDPRETHDVRDASAAGAYYEAKRILFNDPRLLA